MPRVPSEALGKRTKSALIKTVKKGSFIYPMFIVLALELTSILAWNVSEKSYLTFWYPLLTQVTIATLLFGFLPQVFSPISCQRKKIAYYLLAGYYVFNIGAIAFKVSDLVYTEIISYSLLAGAFLLTLFSIYKNRE
jgi:hypothetical protein